jgi:predicted small integral membrane protein
MSDDRLVHDKAPADGAEPSTVDVSRQLYRNQSGQLLLVTAFAAYFVLVTFNNLTDYGTNFAFVQHVMSMDTVPPKVSTQWRAVRNPTVHHLAYAAIISWEALVAVLCTTGAIRAARHVFTPAKFRVGLSAATTGLWLGLMLWVFAFLTVGGEWFLMWQSTQWSGETTAFRMAILNGVTLLLVTPRPVAGNS